ncbi:hypothetical protein HDU87_003893 [Geranomyces variabilis]|uniref:Dynamin-type G domain-containing protein n=1 Tax=Geranomyces variabilis TaxID=109894 RepID=A0AAD5TQT2_9FUNG|nr:hypothetical protein HDU87_003893 [Geranomyces variabilis]
MAGNDKFNPASAYNDTQRMLDKVDRLRQLGVGQHVSLPQLVVAGDQSSGKSSLLESLSGISFPKAAELCTTFPTQIVMRTKKAWEARVYTVPETPNFTETACASKDAVQEIIRRVKEEDLKATADVSETVLVIELNSPELPNLTIIDLPGYVHTSVKGQSDDFKQKIDTMVDKFIQDRRSIILAVIPANKDFATNVVLQRAQKWDPEGDRTIGVVTKPDLVDEGTEAAVIRMMQVHYKELKLGYYMVRNRSHMDLQNGVNLAAALAKEAELLSQPVWGALDARQLGTQQLQTAVVEVLAAHVVKEFPAMREEIQESIRSTTDRLAELGDPLNDPKDRFHLLHFSISTLKEVYDAFVRGDYHLHPSMKLKLRAKVQELNETLYKDIKAVRIVRSTLEAVAVWAHLSLRSLDAVYCPIGHRATSEATVTRVKKIIAENRGIEMPGFGNYNAFLAIIIEMVNHWRPIVIAYMYSIEHLVTEFITAAVKYSVDPRIRKQILVAAESAVKASCKKNSEEAITMWKDELAMPMTCNNYFTDTLHKLRNADGHEGEKLSTFHDVMNSNSRSAERIKTPHDNKTYEAEDVIRAANAYRKTSFKRFADAVCLYATERHIMRGLSVAIIEIPKTIEMGSIGEPPTVSARRELLKAQLAKLHDGLAVL